MRRTITGVLLSTALATSAAVAQERRDSTRRDTAAVQLEGISVSGTRPTTTPGGASVVRARVDSMALPASPTLEGLLRAIPLMHVRRNARGEAEISVRGSDSRQVAVLVDGVPLTLAWDARADVSVLPASAAQSITFARGLPSMLYGPNVLGGVVEIGVGQSFVMPLESSAELAIEADDAGGYGTRGAVTLPRVREAGAWLVRAGVSHRDSPGFPLPAGVSEPVLTRDNLRLNTDARSVDGFLAARYLSAGGAWFSFSGSTMSGERGIAAELGGGGGERFWRYPHLSRTVMVGSGGTGDRGTPWGRGDVEASVGVDLGRTEINSYTDRTYGTLDDFENGDDRTLTLRLLADHTLGARGSLRGAFTMSEIRHDEFLASGAARYRQQLLSAGVETTWRVLEQRGGLDALRLSAGGAYDVGRTPEAGGRTPLGTITELGGRVGATVSLRGGRTLVHGGVSRRGRFPALRELYSGALNQFAPNPDLSPENLVAIEAGVTTRLGAAEIQAVGFRHQMNDAVVRITLPPPDNRFMRVNRNRLRSAGVELLASATLGTLVVGGEVTVQSVELTDPQAGATSRPENLPERSGALLVAFPLPLGIAANAEARHTGRQFCIDPGTGTDAALKAATLVGASLRRIVALRGGGWLRRLEVRAAVDNAGDRAHFDQCGLPQAGRLLRLQLRLY